MARKKPAGKTSTKKVSPSSSPGAIPWSRRDLLAGGPPRTYRGSDLAAIAFPLGGIGAGSVSLGGWGQLRDWEVQNRPAKGFAPMGCFFTLECRERDSPPVTKVLQGPAEGTFVGDGHTARREFGDGLPHFREVAFTGSYPFARVDLGDPDVPLEVTLEAWSPFIPFEDVPSSLPGAVLTYRLTNRSKKTVAGTVFGNLRNFVAGSKGYKVGEIAGHVNETRSEEGLTGLFCSSTAVPDGNPRAGSAFLGTTCPGAAVWARWTDDFLWKFWEAVRGSDGFPPPDGKADIGTVAAPFSVGKGETAEVTFLLTWHFPNFEMYWKRGEEGVENPSWKNYYATLWPDAFEAARDLARNLAGWEQRTRSFHEALASSALPAQVVDALSSNLSILKTNTVIRLPDGTFYGFEGCSEAGGCCEGSCTHVWNYAQTHAYLFPALQRSMLEAHYENCLLEDGYMTFRMPLPPGTKAGTGFHPAADGQLGTVVQIYRDWLLGAGDDWLRKMWPKAKKALEFAWKYWDADRDGVMEGMQHNTYDIEFHGPNSMLSSIYLAALRAGERMARHLGEDASAEEYRRLAESGAETLDSETFNGSYYEQEVRTGMHEAWPERQRTSSENRGLDDVFTDWPRWQYGSGCISDQVLGCWLARMAGLGDVLDPAHVRSALRSAFEHNWWADLTNHACTWRLYAFRDEGGLVLGSWPKGARPGYPFFYFDEVWTGIEYQVASHLIYEGMLDEGLAIVRACRDRFTKGRRNPWDEFECGHHYARALSSWGVLLALSGFTFSAPEKRLGFAPRVNEKDFKVFFSSGTAWGVYSQKWTASGGRGGRVALDVRGGRLELACLDLVPPRMPGKKPPKVAASVGGRRAPATVEVEGASLAARFEPVVVLGPGETLELRVKP